MEKAVQMSHYYWIQLRRYSGGYYIGYRLREECSICGELTSLFRSIPYQGTGNVTQEALCLLLRGKKESFVLSGRAGASALPEEREGTA